MAGRDGCDIRIGAALGAGALRDGALIRAGEYEWAGAPRGALRIAPPGALRAEAPREGDIWAAPLDWPPPRCANTFAGIIIINVDATTIANQRPDFFVGFMESSPLRQCNLIPALFASRPT